MSFKLPAAHWLQGFSQEPIAPVAQRRFDTIIIGGGYTGLSAAITLAEAGQEVAILEQHYCGYGASGRNAGHLTPTIGKDIPTLLLLYGEAKTKELISLAEDAVSFTASILEKEQIACDYQANGNIMAGVTNGQLKRLRKSFATTEKLGVDVSFLDKAEMTQRGIPAAFIGGILEHKGGTLHPGKYLMGLKEKAVYAGVQLIEHTMVAGLENGES